MVIKDTVGSRIIYSTDPNLKRDSKTKELWANQSSTRQDILRLIIIENNKVGIGNIISTDQNLIRD